ncbi:MAG: glycosyltransferase family 1 protein [Thermoprotei archaeon]|nr:MAG: glycosyltransferase family 1 protein [Thermoprotei archaeon]RLE87039.1 MAG: glycosyltransferase family 1 protein [Thermoprotei archaeon]
MDIAFFVWEYPPRVVGGLGTYAQYLTRELVKMGHTVTVLTLNPGNLKTRELIAGVEIHRPLLVDVSRVLPDVVAEDIRRWGPGLDFFAKIFLYNILSASKLINDLIKRESRKFDILSVHDWLSIIAGIITKSELRVPMIFHVHSTEQGRTLGNGSKTIIELEKKGANDADIIVTVSNAMKEELAMLGYPIEKVRVIWNGVDPEKYNPSRVSDEEREQIRAMYGIEYDEFMVLYVGRLAPVKGVDKLIMSMPHVLSKHPNTKLVVLGKGELEQHIKNLVNSLNLEDKVKLRFEFVSEEERIKHYAACDVAVFPSLYEPFGIVALEAMAMAKPLVVGARGVSGFREIVIPSGPRQCGIHINPYDAADIAWGINCILDDPQRGEWMGENGRRRVLEEFTWTKVAERTIKVYEEVLS